MSITFEHPPKSICILRLSAIGDISHTLPTVRTLQEHWPETELTWIIGKTEYSLVSDIEGINFIVFDKNQKLASYARIRKQLQNCTFDVLLHMQMSLRSSLLSLFINAKYKLGFDRKRAKDLQWLFTNEKITYKPRQHVVDSFFCFTEALGIQKHSLRWDIPIPNAAIKSASELIPSDGPMLVISPCSSMAYRNWLIDRYAAVADYAVEKYNLNVIITGGPSAIEKHYAREISSLTKHPVDNLVGKTSLKQLLFILKQAKLVISPDAGPAHLATAVGTPVLGLYATTNPDRARAYLSNDYVVNKYPDAIREKFGKEVDEIPWGTRVRDEGTMARITTKEVISMLDRAMVNQK